MVAFAMHLLRTMPDLKHVTICPDGEHGKIFNFRTFFEKHGFAMTGSIGATAYGGTYSSASGQTVLINPKSGLGDVVADVGGASFVAECKGGVINTKHSGQQSRLRQGLCEVIGLSLASPIMKNRRQCAVVPHTKATEILARRMAPRALAAGIEIALVDGKGNVFDVKP